MRLYLGETDVTYSVTPKPNDDDLVFKRIDAGTGALYPIGIDSVVYDSSTDILWWGVREVDGDISVMGYDCENGDIIDPVLAIPLPAGFAIDAHDEPALEIDDDGYLHVLVAFHSNEVWWAKSNAPNSNAAWTTRELTEVPFGTYMSMVKHPTTGALYGFYRVGETGDHGTVYPSHQFGTIIELLDGATTWTDLGAAIGGKFDGTGHPDSVTDCPYNPHIVVWDSTKLLLTWDIAHGTVHDDTRANVYAVFFDPATKEFIGLGGGDLDLRITWTKMETSCKVRSNDVFVGDGVGQGPHSTNGVIPNTTGPTPVIGWVEEDWTIHLAPWDGASFGHVATGIIQRGDVSSATLWWDEDSEVWHMFVTNFYFQLVRYSSPDLETWTYRGMVILASELPPIGAGGFFTSRRGSHASIIGVWWGLGDGEPFGVLQRRYLPLRHATFV